MRSRSTNRRASPTCASPRPAFRPFSTSKWTCTSNSAPAGGCRRMGNFEHAPPASEMLAYTRYVLDAGMRGDLLALKVALAPCVIGYAEIAARLAARPGASAATIPYSVWIAEYAGAPYQEVAANTRAQLERLAARYSTPAREAELIAIFREATRLEADFWEMGWRVRRSKSLALARMMSRVCLRQINPTGKSPKVCPALRGKIFRLSRRANQIYHSRHPVPPRGRRPSSRTWGRERWTRGSD